MAGLKSKPLPQSGQLVEHDNDAGNGSFDLE